LGKRITDLQTGQFLRSEATALIEKSSSFHWFRGRSSLEQFATGAHQAVVAVTIQPRLEIV
jgi:hypothetical protein